MKAGPIRHGTVYAYQFRRCRCKKCRARNAARWRSWYRRVNGIKGKK